MNNHISRQAFKGHLGNARASLATSEILKLVKRIQAEKLTATEIELRVTRIQENLAYEAYSIGVNDARHRIGAVLMTANFEECISIDLAGIFEDTTPESSE